MKRSMATFAAGALLVTAVMAGCSKSGDKESGSATQSPGKQSAVPSASGGGAGQAPAKYNPPITITTAGEEPASVKYKNGDTVDNNPWTRAYEREYGIKVKTLWQVPTAQLDQKVNLTISSGDLPDFFKVNPTQFKQLLDAGLIADLTDAYNKNASDGVKQLLTEGGPEPMKSATIGGKLMAIPFTGGPKERAPVLWVREDWRKKLNLPEPKTMDDVVKMSEAFATKDPDGNGKADTYGLAVDKDFATLVNGTAGLNGFLNGYHAYLDIWVKDASNQLVYSTVQPEMKTALKKLQDMYKGGQIDPEFGTKAKAKVGEMLTAGKIGMTYQSPFDVLAFQAGVVKDAAMEWKAYPVVSADAKPALNQVSLGINGYWVVRKGYEHPEAILKMLDFWLNTFYLNKSMDVHYEYNNDKETNQEIYIMNKIAAYKPFKNTDEAVRVSKALETNDTSALTPDDKGAFDNVQKYLKGDKNFWYWNAIFNKGGSAAIELDYRSKQQYLSNEFITAPLPNMVEKGANLAKMQTETFTKIILGEASVDEFDKFVDNWKKQGGTDITKEVNDWYAKNK